MKIKYKSIQFPLHLGADFQGPNELEFTYQELLWAAISVGKKSYAEIIKHGLYSNFEIIYRVAIILANLRLNGQYLVKSSSFKNLDPSEKGAITYFLGLTFSKLFASKLLNTTWLLHVDVYKNQFARSGQRFAFAPGKSRPDLIGLDNTRNWNVLESKGRTNNTTSKLRIKAKNQTRKLRKIGHQYPNKRIGCITHFKKDELRFEWIDPEGYDQDAIDIKTSQPQFLKLYYQYLNHNLKEKGNKEIQDNFIVDEILDFKIRIGLHKELLKNYDNLSVDLINNLNLEYNIDKFSTRENTFVNSDGIMISAENLIKTVDE